MNKKITTLIMLVAGLTTYVYGDDKNGVYQGEPHYKLISIDETLEPIERSSYDNLLRVVDDINRRNGKPSDYLGKAYKVQNGEEDKIKFITVADPERESSSEKGKFYRFYFGNGNNAKDISIKTKDEFDKLVKSEEEKKNVEYLIEGVYANKSPWFNNKNGLDISLDDYKNSMVGKTKEEVLNFLATKLKAKKIDAVVENGELYSKDKKGEKWKILWSVEPVSDISYWPEGYKDGLFAKFYIYDEENFDRELYTKSKDTVIENKTDSEIKDKKVEFRGKGVVDGVANFGKDSELTITEQFTGKYGTNIVFSPTAKLENVKVLMIGGMIGNISDSSLSGRTSVTMDIDPTKRDENGYLNQHLLKNSGENLIIASTDSTLDRFSYSYGTETEADKKRKKINRDNYAIEVSTSRLDEETKIDLGRKVEYKAKGFYKKPEEEADFTLKFVPDSIANEIEVEKRQNGQSDLLVVKMKDSIKQLNKDENDVYKSIKNGKQLSGIRDTLSSTNKRTIFTAREDEKFAEKLSNLSLDLRTKSAEETFANLDDFGYAGKRKDEILKDIEEIQKSPEIEERKQKSKELESYKKNNIFKYINDFENMNLKELSNFKDEDTEADKVKAKVDEIYTKNLKPLGDLLTEIHNENKSSGNTSGGLKISEGKSLKDKIELIKAELDSYGKSSWKSKSDVLKKDILKPIEEAYKKLVDLSKIDEKTLDERLIKQLDGGYGSNTAKVYKKLLGELLYTQREEEVLSEFRTLIGQVQEKNIYSRVNKISKDEIDTYTNIPFNLHHDFSKNELYVGGGAITNRNSMDDFKGNIYTGYGIYERALDDKLNLGIMVGGASTSHKEIKNDTLKTVTTTSNIKGYSGYVSAYGRYKMMPQLDILAGLGGQYGDYDVSRDFRNNYQSNTFDGNVKTLALNGYGGVVYKYDIMENLQLQTQGILSYTFINQGKVSEDGKPLSLEIAEQNYNYIDGQIGVNLVKTVPGERLDSSISGGVYLVHGLMGYDNKDLKAKFKGSSSDFRAKGMEYKKDAVKVFLDYNVNVHNGMSYGLEGTYITNSEKDDISIGVKAGYKF